VLLLGPLLIVILLSASGFRANIDRLWSSHRRKDIVAIVASRQEIGDGTISLTLRRRIGPMPRFLAGQHVIVSLHDGEERPIRRAYSLSRWQRLPWAYEISVKREAQGRGSVHLVNEINVGDRLQMSRPQGAFTDPGGPAPLVVAAAGIGVTPFRAMLHARIANGVRGRFSLHLTAREPEGLYFHEEFSRLSQVHEWFHYCPRVTGSAPDWRGEQGRITADIVLQGMPQSTIFMVCAGKAMESELTRGLAAGGVPAQNIHTERFGLSVESVEVDGSVRIGERSFEIGRATTLLDVLERNGITISAECRAGECGGCEVTILEGTARSVISGETQTGRVLACTVVPEGDLMLRPVADA
jgi:ferredoxin-NADP reductase